MVNFKKLFSHVLPTKLPTCKFMSAPHLFCTWYTVLVGGSRFRCESEMFTLRFGGELLNLVAGVFAVWAVHFYVPSMRDYCTNPSRP